MLVAAPLPKNSRVAGYCAGGSGKGSGGKAGSVNGWRSGVLR